MVEVCFGEGYIYEMKVGGEKKDSDNHSDDGDSGFNDFCMFSVSYGSRCAPDERCLGNEPFLRVYDFGSFSSNRSRKR